MDFTHNSNQTCLLFPKVVKVNFKPNPLLETYPKLACHRPLPQLFFQREIVRERRGDLNCRKELEI
jgi:hypothetical protein